jgi:hypothetical protein
LFHRAALPALSAHTSIDARTRQRIWWDRHFRQCALAM